MIADFAIHDKGDGNPHAHILLTLRAMDEHGKWLPKARKVYDLDENGERIQLPSGNWKCHKENTVDWNDQKYAEIWRHSWETITNRFLEVAGRPERVDLRSFERQGIHDTFMKKNFKLTKDAYAAQHKDELESFNKAVRTLMKLNGSTTVYFSALDAEFSALQSGGAELRTQLETLQPDISALKNIRKYIDMVLNKQQLSAPGGKAPEKESVLKKLEEAKTAKSQRKAEQKNHTQEL